MRTLEYLSTTLINNYGDCPFRALESHFNRQTHGDDNEGTDATRFGTIIHTVMEQVHQSIMQNGSFDESKVPEIYESTWKTSQCYDMALYELGKNGIRQFVSRSLHRRIGTTVSIELEFVYDVEADEVFITMEGTKYTRKYYADMVRARGHTPVVSKIDRIDRVSDVEYEVYDYKTNILPFTREQIETSKQLGIYNLVVRALYPDAEKIWCVFDMFRHGRFPVEFPQDWLDNTLRPFLSNLWTQMNSRLENPEPKLNQYCRWCDYRGNCVEYQHALTFDVRSILTEDIDTPEGFSQMFDESTALANLVKVAEARRKEINGMVIAKIETEGMGDPLQYGEREYYLQANPRYTIKPQKMWDFLSKKKSTLLFPLMVSVSKTSMEKALKTRPELIDEIEDEGLIEKAYATPTPKARKLKAGKTSNTTEGENAESTDA